MEVYTPFAGDIGEPQKEIEIEKIPAEAPREVPAEPVPV